MERLVNGSHVVVERCALLRLESSQGRMRPELCSILMLTSQRQILSSEALHDSFLTEAGLPDAVGPMTVESGMIFTPEYMYTFMRSFFNWYEQ